MAEGTALGAYRNNDFIVGDSDTDIMVFDVLKLKLVLADLQTKGFTIARAPVAIGRLSLGTAISIFRDGDWIDIDVFSYTKHCTAVPGPCIDLLPFLKKSEPVKLGNYTYQMPSPPEKYLTYLYGPKWHIPQNQKPKDISR